MARFTAILGAAFVFVVAYLLIGLVLIRAFEGGRLEWAGAALTVVLAASAAVGSYRASMRRSR